MTPESLTEAAIAGFMVTSRHRAIDADSPLDLGRSPSTDVAITAIDVDANSHSIWHRSAQEHIAGRAYTVHMAHGCTPRKAIGEVFLDDDFTPHVPHATTHRGVIELMSTRTTLKVGTARLPVADIVAIVCGDVTIWRRTGHPAFSVKVEGRPPWTATTAEAIGTAPFDTDLRTVLVGLMPGDTYTCPKSGKVPAVEFTRV